MTTTQGTPDPRSTLEELQRKLSASQEETKEALAQQAATNEVLRVIGRSGANLQPVFDFVVESADRLCAADYAFVYLPEGDSFRSVASFGGSPELVEINRQERRFRGRGTLVGRVALEGTIVQIPDVLEDTEYTLRQTQRVGGYRTMLGAPMKRADGSLVGIIGMARNEVRPFASREIQLLETFADQAAIAIENVRLFNETKEALEQQTAVSEVLATISRSAFDLPTVLQTIAERAASLANADTAVISRLDGSDLVATALHGSPLTHGLQIGHRIPVSGPTLSARAVRTLSPHYAEDIRMDPSLPQSGSLTRFAVPIQHNGQALGALVVAHAEAVPFTERQRALVATFADQAAIAIENVRLFNETKEALEQQTATAEILRVIAASPSDITPVLDAIAESAARFCVAENVSVIMPGQDGLLRVRAHVGPLSIDVPPWVVDRTTVTGRSIVEARTIQVPDLQTAGDEYPLGQAQALVLHERTTMAAPLIRDGRGIGALFLRRAEVRPFSDKQVELVKVFADQAVIAIENVRLINETKEALERQRATADILYTISTSPTTDQPVLEAVAKNALRFCGAEDVLVLLVDGDMLKSRAHAGTMRVTDRQGAPITRVPLVRETVSGRATLESRTIHVPDVQSSDEFPLGRELGRSLGEHANLAAPLLQQGKAMGAILLRRTDLHPFGDDDVALAEGFAAQAVIAIENVRLFNETKEALERQTATSELLATMSQSAFDLKPVFEMVLDKSLALCHAEYGWIREFTDDPETIRTIAARMSETMAPIDLIPAGWAARATVLGRVYRERRTLHVADVTADPTVADSEGLIANGARTALGVPLLRGDQRLGSIIIVRTEVRPFEPREIELVESFARQAAIAIENVRLFNEIQDTSRQLEIANRHKSEFLANMSHELRTPLNAIIGFSDVLIGGMAGQLDPKQTEYLEDIRGSGRHLLSLINDILDLSKVEAGRMELTVSEFSLRAALSNAVTMIRERAAGHGIGLDLSVEGIDFISADERKVKQILFNLLSNAVKFTPDGGSITVRAVRQDSETLVSVSDTGVGIPKQDQERIFEEFRQSGAASSRPAEAEGTGLGLALTKSLIELHGGRIWVESEVGKGSTFRFTIPLAPPAAPRASAAP